MNLRTLGSSTLSISPLVFGGNVFGWTADEETSFAVLDAFVDAGFNAIDTADVYSKWQPGHQGGESETILGKWFQRSGKRDKVVLATKAGMEMGPDKKGLSKKYLFSAVEESLRRLQTDHIDLYQAHIDDPETPLAETLEAYAELIQQGKVRAIGASNYSGYRLQEAMEMSEARQLPAFVSLQPHYNLCERSEYEQELEPVCLRYGLGVITYFSLASGFLTGKYESQADLAKSGRGSRVEKYLNHRGFSIVAALKKVAAEIDATPAQVALAWILHHASITAPIVSATSVKQLQEILPAATLLLSKEAMDQLNAAGE